MRMRPSTGSTAIVFTPSSSMLDVTFRHNGSRYESIYPDNSIHRFIRITRFIRINRWEAFPLACASACVGMERARVGGMRRGWRPSPGSAPAYAQAPAGLRSLSAPARPGACGSTNYSILIPAPESQLDMQSLRTHRAPRLTLP